MIAANAGLLSLALLVPVVAAVMAVAVVTTRVALFATRRRSRCGAEGLVGRVGVVRRRLDPLGQMAVSGEIWRARRSWAEDDEPPPSEGEVVVVDCVDRLTLSVRRAETWEVDS